MTRFSVSQQTKNLATCKQARKQESKKERKKERFGGEGEGNKSRIGKQGRRKERA
jgi:hypothetical protein